MFKRRVNWLSHWIVSISWNAICINIASRENITSICFWQFVLEWVFVAFVALWDNFDKGFWSQHICWDYDWLIDCDPCHKWFIEEDFYPLQIDQLQIDREPFLLTSSRFQVLVGLAGQVWVGFIKSTHFQCLPSILDTNNQYCNYTIPNFDESTSMHLQGHFWSTVISADLPITNNFCYIFFNKIWWWQKLFWQFVMAIIHIFINDIFFTPIPCTYTSLPLDGMARN